MAFSSTFTEDSKICPGVQFTLHRIGLSRRSEIDKKTLPYRQRLRELELDYPQQTPKEEELAEQLQVARQKLGAVDRDAEDRVLADVKALARQLLDAVPVDTRKRRAVIDEEYATVQSDIRLVWIRSGLISIAGEPVDGLTPEQLVEYGPPALAQEIYEALTSEGRLAGTAAKNSSSPGTSGAPESQARTNTTAEAANEAGNMASVTASAILQPA